MTQVGRVSQQEHRNIPVLLDKGRYLVVAMQPEQAGRIQPRQEVCYDVQPLPADTVVFRTLTPAARAPDAHVQELVDQASRSRYERCLTHLVALSTRHSLQPGFLEAAAWARGQLEQLGYAAAHYDLAMQILRMNVAATASALADAAS
jgi:hypothetical protein